MRAVDVEEERLERRPGDVEQDAEREEEEGVEAEGAGGRHALGDDGGEEQREERHGDEIADGDGHGHEGAVEAVHHAAQHAGGRVAERGTGAEEEEERGGLKIIVARQTYGVLREVLLVGEHVVQVAAVDAPGHGAGQALQEHCG